MRRTHRAPTTRVVLRPIRAKARGGDKLASMAAEAAFELGAAAARAAKPQPRTNIVKLRRHGVPRSLPTETSRLVTSARSERSVIGIPDNIDVPFDVISAPISYNSTAVSYSFTSNASSVGLVTMLIDPNLQLTSATGSWYMFGIPVANLSSSYSRFRIKRLRVQYEPVVPNSVAGCLALCYNPDGADYNTSTPPTPQQVLGFQGSRSIQVGQRTELGMGALDRSWKYVATTGTTTGSALRWASPGSFMLASIASTTTNTVGYLRLSGVIEFAGLGNSGQGQPNQILQLRERIRELELAAFSPSDPVSDRLNALPHHPRDDCLSESDYEPVAAEPAGLAGPCIHNSIRCPVCHHAPRAPKPESSASVSPHHPSC